MHHHLHATHVYALHVHFFHGCFSQLTLVLMTKKNTLVLMTKKKYLFLFLLRRVVHPTSHTQLATRFLQCGGAYA